MECTHVFLQKPVLGGFQGFPVLHFLQNINSKMDEQCTLIVHPNHNQKWMAQADRTRCHHDDSCL